MESKTSESKTSSPILSSHKSTGSSDDETENEFRLIDFEGEEDEEEVRKEEKGDSKVGRRG